MYSTVELASSLASILASMYVYVLCSYIPIHACALFTLLYASDKWNNSYKITIEGHTCSKPMIVVMYELLFSSNLVHTWSGFPTHCVTDNKDYLIIHFWLTLKNLTIYVEVWPHLSSNCLCCSTRIHVICILIGNEDTWLAKNNVLRQLFSFFLRSTLVLVSIFLLHYNLILCAMKKQQTRTLHTFSFTFGISHVLDNNFHLGRQPFVIWTIEIIV